jgi:integrase
MPRRPLNCCKSQRPTTLPATAEKPASQAPRPRKTSAINAKPTDAAAAGAIATPLVERFAQDYLLDCDYRLHSPKTVAIRRIFLKNLVWFLHHRNHQHCGPTELRQFFVYLAHGHEEEGGRFGNRQLKRTVRPITHKDYWVNFKCFFNWLVEESLIESSPMARLVKPRVPEESVEPFTVAQIKAILEAARRSMHPRLNEAIVLFLLDTGVRASELCGLDRPPNIWSTVKVKI